MKISLQVENMRTLTDWGPNFSVLICPFGRRKGKLGCLILINALTLLNTKLYELLSIIPATCFLGKITQCKQLHNGTQTSRWSIFHRVCNDADGRTRGNWLVCRVKHCFMTCFMSTFIHLMQPVLLKGTLESKFERSNFDNYWHVVASNVADEKQMTSNLN